MLRIISLVFALCALAACGGPSEFVVVGTARAVGADGLVTMEKADGNNLVNISLENLPPPGRVSDGATVYAVWFKPQGTTPQMQGSLDYDPDARTGTLQATTPHLALELVISAEVDATVNSPSDVVIVRQEISAPE